MIDIIDQIWNRYYYYYKTWNTFLLPYSILILNTRNDDYDTFYIPISHDIEQLWRYEKAIIPILLDKSK